jgi:adenosylhomocysteine nucleosidase
MRRRLSKKWSRPLSKDKPKMLALMSAMPQELSCVLERLQAKPVQIGSRTYWQGQWMGQDVVAVLSRIGKVAAATTVTCLIEHFGVEQVVFSGVAGALDEKVKVADVVIASALLQHDVDASPLFPKYEIALTGKSIFATDPQLTQELIAAVSQCLGEMQSTMAEQGLWQQLGLSSRAIDIHEGLILSGDQFISSAQKSVSLKRELPSALAVEMECAAVAQVCNDYEVPFAALRIISDKANDSAHIDFEKFIERVAAPFGAHVMEAFVAHRAQALKQ